MTRLGRLLAAVCLVAPAVGHALPIVHERAISSPTAEAADLFGAAVAADSGWLIAGAPGSDAAGVDAGAAWLVDPASGAVRALEPAPGRELGGRFGQAVAASGGIVAVSAPHVGGAGGHAGAVYLFDATTGAFRAFVPGPTAGALFGAALGAGDATVAVGAPFGANALGQAFLVDAASGTVRRTLRNPASGAYDLFGAAVAAGGGRVVVGAPLDDGAAPNAGAVHVFDAGGARRWTLRSPSATAGDLFGAAVAMVGGDVLVGAPFDDVAGPDAGAAYLFDGASGALRQRFDDPEARRDGRFGWSVAARGDDVVVGAPFADGGLVRLFAPDGALIDTLAAPEPRTGAQFGVAVAAGGGVVVVGAWLADAGAVHVFRDTGAPTSSTATSTSTTTSVSVTLPSTTSSTDADGGAETTTTVTTTSTRPDPPATSITLPPDGSGSSVTTTSGPAPSSTSTTLPGSTLACDDGDACTVDEGEAGGCRARVIPGRGGALCRLGALAALLDEVPSAAVGGRRALARLERRTDVATGLLQRSEADARRAGRDTARARRQLRALLGVVARGERQGRTLAAVADGIRALAEDALGWLTAAGLSSP